jgi:glycosyltransferase involved in cell wall biosynthesis
MQAADITVVIPVYNGAAYLAQAVDSVRRQTRLPGRIVLVDDGSTDATPDIAAGLHNDGGQPPVTYLRRENAGPAAALNLGLTAVESDLVAFLSADDMYVPGKLDWQLQALAAGADLVFGHMQHFISPELDPGDAAALRCPPEPMPAFSAGTLLTRLSTLQAVGPFNEGFRVGEFMDWYGRAIDRGLRSVMLPQVVSMRRVHGGNHSLTRQSQPQNYAHVLKAMLDRRRAAGENS